MEQNKNQKEFILPENLLNHNLNLIGHILEYLKGQPLGAVKALDTALNENIKLLRELRECKEEIKKIK